MTVRRLAARDCLQSCGLTSKGLSLCFSELNYTGCELSSLTARVQLHQDVRHLIQKQKIKPTQKGEKQNEH